MTKAIHQINLEGIHDLEIEEALEADKLFEIEKETLPYKLKEVFYYPVYRTFNRIKDIPTKVEEFWQRGRRGYADSDAWGIDSYLDSFMPELLRAMIDKDNHGGNSYPGEGTEADTPKKWHKIVNTIADGFEASRKMEEIIWTNRKNYEQEYKRLEKMRIEGMTLFVKWYNHLWD